MKRKDHIKLLLGFHILIIGMISAEGVAAQAERQLSLALSNESIAFPFTSYSEFHPGMELGVALYSSDKARSHGQFNTYVGWYLHQHIENAFYLRAEYNYRLKLGKSLSAGVYGGAGYMHTFYPGALYEMDPENGEFSEARQWGRPRALISAGLQLAYMTSMGIEPFIKQEFSVETPFANGIPVMPHSFLKLGININL